jgi:phage shock protein PspC (stress-responsive transcriptional regulator)
MQDYQPSPIARADTLLGICEALGEDFRFNPIYLRLALALGLFWSPVAVIGAYLGMGVIVLLSRLIAPNPRLAAAPDADDAGLAAGNEAPAAGNDADQYPLPIAA